jgi:sugar phosphate isomerase/epimerase
MKMRLIEPMTLVGPGGVMMQIGICAGPEFAAVASKAGVDYFEWTVGAYLQPRQDEAAFKTAVQKVKSTPSSCPAVNIFIPADLKITGPSVDMPALTAYAETALERARQAGVKVIVFGSGGARRIPEGFERQAAEAQLVNFGRMLGPLARQAGVMIAVEPLNRKECNILNSVAESALYVRKVDHPSFRLLVDAYHWALEDESPQAIADNGDLLVHAHIATKTSRLPPGAEDFDFLPFFQALSQARYNERISIEAKLPPIDDQSHLEEVLRTAVSSIRAQMAG